MNAMACQINSLTIFIQPFIQAQMKVNITAPPHCPLNLATEQQCKNITEDEAPRHGGMVCNWFNDQSSIICGVRCNPGYEHPDNVNTFETCGSAKDFEGSFRTKMNNTEANYPSSIGKP